MSFSHRSAEANCDVNRTQEKSEETEYTRMADQKEEKVKIVNKSNELIDEENDSILQFNIGGEASLAVKKSLFSKYSETKLAKLVQNESLIPKLDGKIFIDR